ncbi:helix-turn-helix domain-containing protein [Lactobacillus sp. ESL0677]|uniref:helix-turn-helix domain-containing protein n=1 Tax=Lactobacillus sp. ESL0677 TaxID=2983208 RepID=UPI0023F92C52|nr:helix-turn-helix domain-containing protein [Lactobacillus sp. ESL0677]WEV36252.1 helix-turn-helix domain-containing protein [Lactobacillus sp. ESL0677]
MSLINETEFKQLLRPMVQDLVIENMSQTPVMDIRWLSKTHAAAKLDVNRSTFYRLRKEHAIPSSTVDGIERYSTADLKEFMDEYRS